MTLGDNAALVKRRDSRDATGRSRAIPLKAKVAIRLLIEDPKADLQAAAAAAGLSTEWLRRYMTRPEVQRYWREEKRVAFAIAASGNPAALRDIRDNSANATARVNAARALELGLEEIDKPNNRAGASLLPGFTILIRHGLTGAIGPVIDATADEVDDASLVYQDDR
jgi:hypothetical protein